MKRVLAGLVVAVGFMGLAQAAGNPEAGQSKAGMCVACHSADGNSLVPNFPKLAGQGAPYLLKQMKDIKAGERVVPEMIGMLDAFNEQDLQDLAAYFASQKGTTGAANADLVELGEALYRGGNLAKGIPACTSCHMPSGEGNAPAGYPKLSGQHPTYTEAQLKKFRSGERTNDGESRMMRDIAAKLSDAEITAVSSYIFGLHN